MMRAVPPTVLLLLTAWLASCSLLKKVPVPSMPKLPKLPKLSLPSMNTVAKIVPGMPERDKVDAEDPDVPFNSRGTLGFGHTLRIDIYEGARDPERIYHDIVMVNTEGLLPLGQAGTARVGGLHLPAVADAIATVFRLAGRNTRPITVHILSVENTPVVSVNGDVREPEFVPAFEDMTVQQAITVSGGRKAGSAHHGVYITREGQRRFFTSLEKATADWTPRAGDIITLSPDI